MIKNNLINIKVKENLIGVMRVGNTEYISLTDIARYKNPDNPSDVLKFWMSNKNSFDFYSLWEELFNPNFNSAESRRIKNEEVGYNSFTMTPNQWKKRTDAIGIIPSTGRYSKGTFAHPDIALEFASWIDIVFKLYLMIGDDIVMNDLEISKNTFESIKHIDENGFEYWSAREFMQALEYKKWDKFINVIDASKIACEQSNNLIDDHFPQVEKMVEIGSKTKRKIIDYKLSRYACYLIVQNSNPRKKSVALGQTYFAVQTRRMEINDKEYSKLTEDEKRLYQRNLTKKGNYALNQVAKNSGVKNFDKFHNYGYKGLYNGETANDISVRKGLRYREDILDNMGSDELIVNLFRISQTEQKLRKDNVQTEKDANRIHYKVGSKIRNINNNIKKIESINLIENKNTE